MATTRVSLPVLLLYWFFLAPLQAQTLNILAFEYSRKLWEIPNLGLEIGQCAHSVEEVFPGHPLVKECYLPPARGQKLHSSRNYKLNDTQNIEVKSPRDIFTYIGLCDAAAVSRLGLLHRGDCIAIEIASNLTFNKKTYTRAYVEYYRHDIDILSLQSDFSVVQTAGFGKEYYLKNRSIGTMEIVLVEMKFPNKRKANLLKNSHYQSLSMKDWISYAFQEAGEPANTKIIRLSTAKRLVEIKKYKRGKLAEIAGLLGGYEAEILETRREIERGYVKPHLNYALQPYFSKGAAFRKGSDSALWEEASITEIKINRAKARQNSIKRSVGITAKVRQNSIKRSVGITTKVHQNSIKRSLGITVVQNLYSKVTRYHIHLYNALSV
ncbi:uncharacterized protein LOC125657676 isoform X3 [Ostrea edulis]|uniref:uncharacterized protein LOC125657676 isoform X3 n=1 Tax=Ostrea edulis TaxID=37623 RepID=UPI0024AF6B8C|nr:uncharacterized protein LOC125657676 isoform X3 [Ostrea edulis]